MAVLGKRKAREAPSVSQEDAEAIFRRHFESQFAPIDATPLSNEPVESDEEDEGSDTGGEDTGRRQDDSDDDDDEWDGFSEDDAEDDGDDDEEEEEDTIEVIDHSKPQAPKPLAMSKRELKAFMSSRPPDQTAKSKSTETTQKTTSSSTLPEDAPSLLAQDLELRRLISESHLLSSLSNSSSGTSSPTADDEPKLFASGRVRQKATDLRIQTLGSKHSVFTQKSMPMNMRKGIVAAAASREAKRRKQAKENGVILEREVKTDGKKKKGNRSRDTGFDMPGMGKFRGAELRLNDREVKGIEGSRDVFGRKGGGRRR